MHVSQLFAITCPQWLPGTRFFPGGAFDTLSPILLVRAIDQLHHLIRLAADLASSYWSGQERHVAVFYNTPKMLTSLPTPTKMSSLQLIGKASGLVTNILKNSVFSIHYEDIDLHDLLTVFLTKIGSFPWKYLGLPFTFAGSVGFTSNQ